MNRLIISTGILVLLTALCVTSLFTVHGQCRDFSAQAELVMDAAASGDTERALADCEQLLQMWEDFHDIMGLFVDGERLDAIREILAGLPALIAEKHPEVLSQLKTLQTLAEDLFLEEVPDWAHIL